MFSFRSRGVRRLCAIGVVAALASGWSGAATAQSELVRLGSATHGTGSYVSVAALGDQRLVSAGLDASSALQLKSWNVSTAGSLAPLDSASAGTTSQFALAGFPAAVVTALRKSDGGLRLIHWGVDGLGTITRNGSIDAGAVQRIAIAVAGPRRVVTATQESDSIATKLIVWDFDSAGVFTRRGSVSTDAGTQVAIAAINAGQLVTAVRDGAGLLSMRSWTLSTTGELTQLGAASGPAVSEITLTNTASDRAVTAVRLADGSLQLDAWDVAGTELAKSSTVKAGGADHITLTALGAAKVLTALRQSDGTLKLITWRVVDQIQRLDSIAAGAVDTISTATLGWDRAVTALHLSTDELKLINWGDWSVGLLKSDWDRTATTDCASAADVVSVPSAGPVAGQSPPPSLVFEPRNIRGVDPMIAVGKQYVLLSEDHFVKFVAKTGADAGKQLPSKAGEATCMSTARFFRSLLAPKLADGVTTNRNNLNLHLRLPHDPAHLCHQPAIDGDACMREFYDTRVHYDAYSGRFVVLAAIRTGGNDETFARRHFAVAVSKTEDPRDGFVQYVSTESNTRDWPRMGIADGMLLVAHNAPLATTDSRPMGYVINTADLLASASSPRNWKIYAYQTDGGTLSPVLHHGSSNGWALFYHAQSTRVYGFRQDLTWTTVPTLQHTASTLSGTVDGLHGGVVYRGERLYLAGGVRNAARVANQKPERWSVRELRIPVDTSTTTLSASPCPTSAGCVDDRFGVRASDDTSTDVLSYEMASIAVNKNGDMLTAYGRVPVTMTVPKGQETRYSVHYADARGRLQSRVLRAGELVLKDIWCKNNTPDTTPVAENFWHIWSKEGTCATQKHYQDYSSAVVDPSDDTTFWIALSYASPDVDPKPDKTTPGFGMVAGKVVP